MASARTAEELRVLCLEDNLRDAELIREHLEDDGYTVKMVVVAGREDFVAALERGNHDIVFIDFTLPTFDGSSALELACRISPDTPSIVVSGTIGEDRAVELLKQGAADYVLKDRMGRLGFAVKRALESSRRLEAQDAAETALLAATHELDSYFNLALDLFAIADTDGYLRRVNPQWRHVLGYTRSEMEGHKAVDFIHPDDRAATEQAFASLAEQQPIVDFTNRYRAKDGVYHWLEWRSMPQGDVIYAAAHDITARREAEQALLRSTEKLRDMLHDTVAAMGAIVTIRDPYTSDHEQRTTRLALAIADLMRLPHQRREGLELAAAVHDVGKVGVPAEILSKPGTLTTHERQLVQQHPAVGRDILAPIAFEWPVADIVYQHHERLDGSGYPEGLRGEQISTEARILAVADVVEAMSGHRPYRPALGIEAALDEIRDGAGTRYDAAVVAACEKVIAAGSVDLSA
jgi:PAS domain S-box-containing protein